MNRAQTLSFPVIRTIGTHGVLVSFSDHLSDAQNRAALAFRAAVQALRLGGIVETSTTLTSVFVRFDPTVLPHRALQDRLSDLLAQQDWSLAELPAGRRLWQVPTVYGTELAPQLGEAADLAGMSESAAIESLGAARVRVLTLGFAPGQPYLGPLEACWDIPRQSGLTPQVPRGALVAAVAQLVLFAAPSPTGWRHVGQTGFSCFDLNHPAPIALRVGDEMQFVPVSPQELATASERDPRYGGAQMLEIDA